MATRSNIFGHIWNWEKVLGGLVPDQIGLHPQDSLANSKGDFDCNSHQHCELEEVLSNFWSTSHNISIIPTVIRTIIKNQYHLESNMLHHQDKADHEASNTTHPCHEPEDGIDVHAAW